MIASCYAGQCRPIGFIDLGLDVKKAEPKEGGNEKSGTRNAGPRLFSCKSFIQGALSCAPVGQVMVIAFWKDGRAEIRST